MRRVIAIDRCEQCGDCDVLSGSVGVCDADKYRRLVRPDSEPPDWCPLPSEGPADAAVKAERLRCLAAVDEAMVGWFNSSSIDTLVRRIKQRIAGEYK